MLEQSLFISLCVIGVWATMWKGMIFGFVREWGDKHLPEYIQKMLYDCPICQCPYFGVPVYIFTYGLTEQLPFVILGAMGINAVFVKFLPENWYNQEE